MFQQLFSKYRAFLQDELKGVKINVCTFGAPSTGDASFTQFLKDKEISVICYEYASDPVPRLVKLAHDDDDWVDPPGIFIYLFIY